MSRTIGVVKSFDVNKGCGWIEHGIGPDVFCHFRQIRGAGFKILTVGQQVEFSVEVNFRGSPHAVDVVILEPQAEDASHSA